MSDLMKEASGMSRDPVAWSVPVATIHPAKVGNGARHPFFKVALIALTLLTVIQQAPLVYSAAYGQVRLALYLGFGSLVVSLALVGEKGDSALLRKGGLSLSYLALVLLGAGIVGSVGALDIFMLHAVPFLILFCSSRVAMGPNVIRSLLVAYVVTVAVVSTLISVSVGFEISGVYAVESKNQVGPMLGSAMVSALFLVQDRGVKTGLRIGLCAALAVIAANALVVRNRSGLLAVALVAGLMLLMNLRSATKTRLLVGLVGVSWGLMFLGVLGLLDEILGSVWSSFTANYTIGDFESLSAGRASGYLEAIEFALANPFFGELGTQETVSATPHNYLLFILVRVGLLGGASLLVLYGHLLWSGLKHVFMRNTYPSWVLRVTSYVALSMLVVSLFEYTYPYGPATSQTLLWVLLGQVEYGVRGSVVTEGS